MKRVYPAPISYIPMEPLHREPLVRSLFRTLRRPIRHRMIEIRLKELELEMRTLARLAYRALDGQNERALCQIREQQKATQIVINGLIEESNGLRMGS
jgi:hypothetical protein